MLTLEVTPINEFKIVTLDFETAYQSTKKNGLLDASYSLKSLTYEEYLFHEHYKALGVGIKIDSNPTVYYRDAEIEEAVADAFSGDRPILLLCHNTLFDGAILSWKYGLVADRYVCTLALSKSLWPGQSHSLDNLLIRLFPDDDSKRKTHELETIDGVWTLNPEQDKAIEGYCINDVEQTFAAFVELYRYIPEEELEVLDLTLRMFIVPGFQLDTSKIENYLADLQQERAETLTQIHEQQDMETVVEAAALEAEGWLRTTEFHAINFIDEAIRTWKHHSGMAARKPRKKDTEAIQAIMDWQDEHYEDFPPVFTLLAWRLYYKDAVRGVELTDKVLSGADTFAAFLHYRYGIKVPRKASPTPKNKNNTSWALAKDDLEFLDLQKQYPDHRTLFNAKVLVSSTIEAGRAKRLLVHSGALDGWLAAPLNYCGALTKRWSGTNKVNFQNFGRKSPIRRALLAPEGYQVGVVDLSNIESRVLAWFAQCEVLNDAYAQERDLYNEFASIIYERPIDRKRTAIDNETGKEIIPDYVEGLVGKVCILGLGYGMGWRTLQTTFAKGAMGAPQLFFDDEFCQKIVHNYRGSYPEIKNAWDQAQQVIFDMTDPNIQPYSWGCIQVEYRRLKLPNGHYLNYHKLRQAVGPDDSNAQFQYWNGDFWKNLYGGLLIENVIQALSRIIMAWHMVEVNRQLKKVNGRVLLTVHDEVVFIAPTCVIDRSVDMCIETMRQPLPWCADGSLTLDAEGGFAKNYSK